MTEPDLLSQRTESDLLGPDSLHWRYAGDNRLMLVQVKTALLQLMHPGLGAGVQQHSRFFSASFAGLTAAVPAIQGVTYDWPDCQATALGIRDRHWEVKGVDGHGNRYHALNPDTYFWGHATMLDMLITAIDLFDHPLTGAEKERLYQESLAQYELYGVSTRTVPRSWPAFAEYFDTVCADELDLTTAAAAMLTFRGAPPELSGALAKPASVLAGKPLGRLMWWIGLGTLHPAVKERIGLDWTAADEERLARLGRAIGHGWPVLPPRLRYSKRARTGMHRVRSAAA
jgi:uncharacterized protein (DUF2236 family)